MIYLSISKLSSVLGEKRAYLGRHQSQKVSTRRSTRYQVYFSLLFSLLRFRDDVMALHTTYYDFRLEIIN